ncbi:AAA family ATPase [Paenibacillus vini]|uniref:AAA+ ATPase domain-containing protein n=1 Tax=Paenibacillus vini TaxID=1476024 RepID=A0ABQ4M8R5_9BACL|nr:AAA family ATPase [Paenibacillus vini]GIP52342.1 hypothetical protein J42TS3_13770 [Paenibacillus vini]
MDIRQILKFIFPEYQIIESVRKYGFIAKKSTPESSSVKPIASIPGSSADPGMRNEAEAAASGGGNDKIPYSGTIRDTVTATSLDKSIALAKEDVLRQFIGQRPAVEHLFIAMKRPFVSGFDGDKPRNTLFLIGGESMGKHTLVHTTVAALKEQKLLSYEVPSRIDLGLYPALSDKGLFLSDLYKAMYTNSDVVIVERFELAHKAFIDVLSGLIVQGKYQLGARYAMQNNVLVEATGVLAHNSVSELSANGKFFVFVTGSSKSRIEEAWSPKVMEVVGDLIRFEDYSEQDIRAITLKLLRDMELRCKNQLSLRVVFTDNFVACCSSRYKKTTGIRAIEEYIFNFIYKALSDYKLRNPLPPMTEASLDYVAGRPLVRLNTGAAVITTVDLSESEWFPDKTNAQIDEVRKELNAVVGLDKVKEYVYSLENHGKVQHMREEAGFLSSSITRHMIFTGNPGTGKTTIARIVAKYLKAIGVLSTGQLREVSRADLVGQYTGQTAKQTNDVIQAALGGVLFIDEAYALCRDKHDTYGQEAVDTLVKAMEDHRDDLVVILAGYRDEMERFLKTNSGLKSRFPVQIEFEDYTAEEMAAIAEITAASKGYRISESCQGQLLELFEKSQIKGRNDGGNGRLVRNVIERAILEQGKRIAQAANPEMDLLCPEDFRFADKTVFDLEQSLSEIIGLEEVKDFLRIQYKLLLANEKRKQAGITVDSSQSLNMVFTGNPGTGKTTMARVVANMVREMGLLKQGHLVETDRNGLVAEYAGHTPKKTEEVFRSALGGVLFIDEAYTLKDNGSGYGKEAIDTLVKLIEDYRGEIVVILAGYNKEMTDFMKSNSGLASRFPLTIEFPDYSGDELYRIALKMIAEKGFTLTEPAKTMLYDQLMAARKAASAHTGNARMVRNRIENIMRNQSARVADQDDVTVQGLTEIIETDIQPEKTSDTGFDLEQSLSGIVGLDEVKDYVRSLHARLKMENERKKLGLGKEQPQTFHMIFMGNPGTGKTMMARTIAHVLYHMGIVKTSKLVETDRSGLVAGYVGHTALKTTHVVNEALDGVLFIDEAYALAKGNEQDYGREAIDTLVKLMDDHRERLVVILAGYGEEMMEFLATNPGLKSRFPNIIEFPDYSPDELMVIADGFYSSGSFVLSNEAREKLYRVFEHAVTQESFGNGRYVRNVAERSVNRQALRLTAKPEIYKEELVVIDAADIEEV